MRDVFVVIGDRSETHFVEGITSDQTYLCYEHLCTVSGESSGDCGMFDFDDLDEAEALQRVMFFKMSWLTRIYTEFELLLPFGPWLSSVSWCSWFLWGQVHVTPSKHTDVASSSHMDCPVEPAEPIPAAHTDCPAAEPIPAVPAAASTPPNIALETGPPEQKPQPQPEESEKIAPETEVPSKKIDDESAMPGMLKIIETQRFHHLKIVLSGSQVWKIHYWDLQPRQGFCIARHYRLLSIHANALIFQYHLHVWLVWPSQKWKHLSGSISNPWKQSRLPLYPSVLKIPWSLDFFASFQELLELARSRGVSISARFSTWLNG